ERRVASSCIQRKHRTCHGMRTAPSRSMAVRKPKPSAETHPGAEAFLPVKRSLPSLRASVPTCRGCPLYQNATQAVFGEGAATAAQALLGSTFRVTKVRGEVLETPLARFTFATVHPSSVLRAPDDESRRKARQDFFDDIAVVGHYFRKL